MSASPGPSVPQSSAQSECPVCDKLFPTNAIEAHVNRCIFLNTQDDSATSGIISSSSSSVSNGIVSTGSASKDTKKRTFGLFDPRSPIEIKKQKTGRSTSALSNGRAKMAVGSSSTVIDLDDDGDEENSAEDVDGVRKLYFFNYYIN